MSNLNKLKDLVSIYNRELSEHKADPSNPNKVAAWDFASSLLGAEIDRDAVGLVMLLLQKIEIGQQRITELEMELISTNPLYSRRQLEQRLQDAEAKLKHLSEQEPDYWQFKAANGKWIGIREEIIRHPDCEGCEVRPLYASPRPVAAALTNEKLREAVRAWNRHIQPSPEAYQAMREALGCKELKPVKLPGISELIELVGATPNVRDVSTWDATISICAASIRAAGYEVTE